MKISSTLQSDVSARLAALPSTLSFQVRSQALKAAAEPIRAEAAIRAPRDPESNGPHLADNIVIDALSEAEVERSAEFFHGDPVVEIGPSIPHFYGSFAEYGTARQPARPWFRPAFDQNIGRTINIYATRLWAALKGSARQGSTMGGGRNL